MLKSSYRKIWSNILTTEWRQAHGATKWIRKQSQWSLRGSDSCKKNNNWQHHFYELPWCCNCMYERRCLWKHSNSGRGGEAIVMWLFPGGWLITIAIRHSSYLVCGSQHMMSISGKWVKLQLSAMPILIKWIYNNPVRRKRHRMFIHHFRWCICSLFWR